MGEVVGCAMPARFPDRLRLPLEFEPAALAADLATVEVACWTEHFVKQNCDGDWSAIALRAPGRDPPAAHDLFRSGLYRLRGHPLPSPTPYPRQVLAAFACPLMSPRLMRLAPAR